MAIVNNGIQAHVSADKTSPTRHLPFEAGDNSAVGWGIQGRIATGNLELERDRGIRVEAVAAAFHQNTHSDNLIGLARQCGGVAAVERSPWVQPRLSRADKPSSRIFINDIDRPGAAGEMRACP